MAKQAIKKKTGSASSSWLNNFKQSNSGTANKPLSWIEMPEGYVTALKLPGIPEGVLTIIGGHSNTGKSSLVNGAIVGAMKKGILPVIIDTENNFSFTFAKAFGMQCEPVYGDVQKEVINQETGEIETITENGIVRWDGDFVFMSYADLLNRYGKTNYATGAQTSNRTVVCLEDVAACMKEFLDAQDNGDLQRDILFIWDSVGSVSSFDSLNATNQQNMRDANRLKESFKNIIPRITNTRAVTSPYSNTMLVINKVWTDNMTMPGKPGMELSGGEGLKYGSRLVIQLGGNAKASAKYLNATAKGQKYCYGIETKIKVIKNQLDAPFNVTYEATMCCVNGIVSPEKLDDYKKAHMDEILTTLNNQLGGNDKVSTSDVQYEEVEQEGE